MFYTTFSPTSPSSLIQGHLCHCTVYLICPNRAPGEVAMLAPGTRTHTHTRTHRFSHQLSRSCWIDRITPCGAAPTPPGSPLSLAPLSSCAIPLQHGRVTANQAFLSLHCGARVCKAIALPHPWSGHGEAESDGGCHLTASNST